MMKKTHVILFSTVIFLTCMVTVHSDQTEYQELVDRIEAINELINDASDSNGLWRETKNLSDSAKKFANTGNFTLANEILLEAEFQAKQGIQQAQEQTDINSLIPSYLQH